MDKSLETLGHEVPMIGMMFGYGPLAGVAAKEYTGIRDLGLKY